ncbi:putative membrane protein YhfC [Saccharococcus thermophilus]|uniref:Putative membrane protein YhfC n=1 Tax=Saccharococcus thermophilus TaxID=29396 RepID=A0A846MEG0_9BACL|nr:putative membrane protein YhfC [Saccharococcus thermophilus]
MISTLSIAGMVTQLVMSLFVPLGLLIYFHKRKWLSWKPLGIGVLLFYYFRRYSKKRCMW